MTTRWFAERSEGDRAAYAQHFLGLVRSGQDIDGEARLVEPAVLHGIARVLRPGGRAVFGFATWDLEPWHEDADWAVCVYRD